MKAIPAIVLLALCMSACVSTGPSNVDESDASADSSVDVPPDTADDTSADDVATDDTAVEDTAVEDTAVEDTAVEDTASDTAGDTANDTDGDTDADAADAPDTTTNTVTDTASDTTTDTTTDTASDTTTDTASDTPEDSDTPVEPPPVFDMEMIADPTTADCTFTNHRTTIREGVNVDVWDVTYNSWEVIDGELQTIQIRAFASRPVGATGIPGVVQAHGLGGFAEDRHATGLAGLLEMFTLAYTGPGGGTEPINTSQGLPSGHADGYRMFDTITDPRGSWFWGHAVAAMRGVTCLENHPDVDPTRLGMTGFSAGGVVTLISSAVDDRLVAGVPLSGTGAWDVATQSPNAWQHSLLTAAGLTTASEEWTTLIENIDSSRLLHDTNTQVFMVNGSTDEFFPLTAHMATYNAIPESQRRTAIAGNFDHGCYALTGVESESTIAERADLVAKGAQRAWFHHWFGTDSTYSYLPVAPTMELAAVGPATLVTSQVDTGGSELDVESVHVWWSNDDSLIYGSVELDDNGGGVYSKLAGFPLQANTIAYVHVVYTDGGFVAPERFALSSPPRIPDGLIPSIRRIDACVP